jgi:hypothetical protein
MVKPDALISSRNEALQNSVNCGFEYGRHATVAECSQLDLAKAHVRVSMEISRSVDCSSRLKLGDFSHFFCRICLENIMFSYINTAKVAESLQNPFHVAYSLPTDSRYNWDLPLISNLTTCQTRLLEIQKTMVHARSCQETQNMCPADKGYHATVTDPCL